MTTLALRARQNRQLALQGLARRRSGNVVSLATARDRSTPLPVLSFAARRMACPELATQVPHTAARTPAAPLLLVSDRALPRAA